MTAFEHISVLISIVIGFAVTTLLGGAVRLAHRRHSVVWYWPSALWMITVLLIDVQVWWSRFSWRRMPTWTFATFFTMLWVPIGVYALSALLVAEPDERPIDMRREYFARRQVFFSILIVTVAVSYLPDILTGNGFGNRLDASLKGAIMIVNAPAIFSADERLQKFLSVFGLVMICGYIAALFSVI